jgi:hypothetical protein
MIVDIWYDGSKTKRQMFKRSWSYETSKASKYYSIYWQFYIQQLINYHNLMGF